MLPARTTSGELGRVGVPAGTTFEFYDVETARGRVLRFHFRTSASGVLRLYRARPDNGGVELYLPEIAVSAQADEYAFQVTDAVYGTLRWKYTATLDSVIYMDVVVA